MSIAVPIDVESEIQERVANGRYPDDAAVMRAVMDALDRQERRRRLLDALKAGEQGEGTPYTPDLMARIAREAEEADRLNLPINPDVCP